MLTVLTIFIGNILLFFRSSLDNPVKKIVIAFKLSWLVFFCAIWKYKEDPVLIPKVPSPSKNPMNQFGFIIIWDYEVLYVNTSLLEFILFLRDLIFSILVSDSFLLFFIRTAS